MDSTRISLARVLELGVRVSWREAVAITLHACAASGGTKARGAKRPRIDTLSCLLTRGGDVEFAVAAKKAELSTVGTFFREILTDPETPPELMKLARMGGGEHLADDLETLASAPKRRRVEIASVAIRGLAAEAELARRTVDTLRGLPVAAEQKPMINAAGVVVPADEQDAEFNRLRALVGNLEGGEFTRRRSFRRTVDLRLVGGIGVPAALGLVWWLWSPGSPALPAPPRLPDMPRAIKPVGLDSNWASIGSTLGTLPPAPQASITRDSPVELETRSQPNETTNPVVQSATPAPVAEPDRTPQPTTTPPPAPPPATPPAPRPRTPPAEPLDTSVYSVANRGVEPPVLRYPNLPNAVVSGDTAPITGPYFDVLVDQAGRVETVRLRGRVDQSETYYRLRMMLAAAKAWQFSPAKLDGRPVRYAARVVLRP